MGQVRWVDPDAHPLTRFKQRVRRALGDSTISRVYIPIEELEVALAELDAKSGAPDVQPVSPEQK